MNVSISLEESPYSNVDKSVTIKFEAVAYLQNTSKTVITFNVLRKQLEYAVSMLDMRIDELERIAKNKGGLL